MSLQHRIENNFEPEVIHESDIKQYEFLVSTTAQSDISTLVNYKLQANYAGSDLGIDLYDAYLWGKYKFQKLVLGTDLDAASRVALTSSAWSLFSDLSLSINGTRVELIENCGYAMDIISKCKNSYDWFVDNSDQMQFWPPSFANDLTTAVPAVNATNANWLAHATAPSTSKYFALKLRDVLGFCNTSKILPSCNIELTMNRNTNYAEYIMRSAAGDDLDAKAVIEELRLYVPTVKVKERLANQLSLRALEGKAIPVNFQHIAYQRMTTTSGTSPRLVIHSASKRPRYVLVAVQPSANIATQSGVNGHVYASTSPSEAYLSVNGQMYPFHKYATASEGATREIANIKALFGKVSSDCSMIIRPANFTTMNTIYAFDCSHVQDLFEENSNANINMQFYYTSSENGAQTFHAILISDEYMKFSVIGGALSLASAH